MNNEYYKETNQSKTGTKSEDIFFWVFVLPTISRRSLKKLAFAVNRFSDFPQS